MGEPEQAWRRSRPAVMAEQPTQVDVDRELQIVKVQQNYEAVHHEVNVRDQMSRDLHDRLVHEVQLRDEIIDGLRREQDWMRSGWRRFVIRLPRQRMASAAGSATARAPNDREE